MKFQVRDGYVVRFVRKIQIAEDKFQDQEIVVYGGQVIDLDEAEANDHAHKLEAVAKDKEAVAFLDAKVLPPSPAASGVLDPGQLAMIQETAKQTALAVAAALQATAQPAQAAAATGG